MINAWHLANGGKKHFQFCVRCIFNKQEKNMANNEDKQ